MMPPQESVPQSMLRQAWQSLTSTVTSASGVLGLAGISVPAIAGWHLDTWVYVLIAAAVVLVWAVGAWRAAEVALKDKPQMMTTYFQGGQGGADGLVTGGGGGGGGGPLSGAGGSGGAVHGDVTINYPYEGEPKRG